MRELLKVRTPVRIWAICESASAHNRAPPSIITPRLILRFQNFDDLTRIHLLVPRKVVICVIARILGEHRTNLGEPNSVIRT